MKVYKKIIIAIIFAVFIIIAQNKVEAASDFSLNSLDFDAKLNVDGSMDVIETWKIRVHDTTNTLFKTFKIDNSKYSGLSNISVSELINNEEVDFTQNFKWKNHVDTDHFHATTHKGEFEIAWGVNKSSGSHTYIVKYKVNNVVSVHSDCAELYWQFIGKDFEAPASVVTGKITLPTGVEVLDNLRVWGHGQLNGDVRRASNKEVTFNVSPFITGKFLEIRVAILEPGMFSDSIKKDNNTVINKIITEETEWANKANAEREAIANREKYIKYGTIGVSAVVGAIFVFFTIKGIKKLNEIERIEPTEQFEYFRDIPNENESPAEVAFLYYYRKNTSSIAMPRILSATMLDLSLKKYITFEVDNSLPKKEQVTIKLIDDPNAQELRESEKLVLDLFRKIPKDSSVPQFNMKEFEKYAKKHNSSFLNDINKIEKKAKQEQKEAGHYDEKMEEHNNNWKAGGIIIITFLAMVSLFLWMIFTISIFPLVFAVIPGVIYSVICFAIAGKYTGLTQTGLDERVKWEALKKYMEEYSMIEDRDVPAITVWEKYLVYATLFGNAEEVLKQLKVVYPQFSDDEYLRNTSYFYLMSHSSFKDSFVNSVDSAMRSAYQSSVASSSSSSGGGYGGGFSGGGGGRWRRRPVVADVRREKKRI